MDWLLTRLAFDERTRGRVEDHRARLFVDVLTDLAALDALDGIADLYRAAEDG